MIIKKKVNAGGQFIDKKEDIKDGDIITILNGGVEHESEFGPKMGFLLETSKGERVMDLNQTTQNNLVDAFGEETNDWVGKKVKVVIVRGMVSGKMQNIVYLAHPDWEMDDEGKFHAVIKTD